MTFLRSIFSSAIDEYSDFMIKETDFQNRTFTFIPWFQHGLFHLPLKIIFLYSFPFRPILLSWIKANSKEAKNKLYSKYHVDQLTNDDSTSFHYTAVIYLDDESYQFHGGHLQFGDGAIYTPRRGLAVIFTSGEENLHRVTPVMWGMRRALVIFLTCDKALSITSKSFL